MKMQTTPVQTCGAALVAVAIAAMTSAYSGNATADRTTAASFATGGAAAETYYATARASNPTLVRGASNEFVILNAAAPLECSQRVGPFATQTTAYQRLEQAKRLGYGVSGVFPCYDEYSTRGYCFNVFYPC